MKNKIIAICISFILCAAFVVPSCIFAEENAVDNASQAEARNNEQVGDGNNLEQTSDDTNNNEENALKTENENYVNANAQDDQEDEEAAEAKIENPPQNSPEDDTPWSKLKKKIEDLGSGTITVDEDVTADPAKDNGKTIEIKSGQNVILNGSHSIKGIGYSSFKIEKGGSLTIDGPIISNAQITTEGGLTLNNGKISDTKLEGPTIFVNSGTFTMNGGEVSGNEAQNSQKPQPINLRVEKGRYLYSPITVYNGTFNLNSGEISGNKGFFKGGAIGIWGQDSSKSNFKVKDGKITNNIAISDNWNSYGGAIFMENCSFEMNSGTVSQNTTEYGGGIAAIKSTMTFKGGNITENTNGDYKGLGGGVYAEDTNVDIKNINISDNIANGHGGGIFVSSSQSKKYKLKIDQGSFKNNATDNDNGLNRCRGGAIFAYNYICDIYGGEYLDNSAYMSGGAIGLGGKGECTIQAGIFKNNESNGFWGGGAIYNDHGSKLIIKRALIRNNFIDENVMFGAGNHPASRQGGGIWNCPSGNTTINITNGLALFDNSAKNSGSNIGAGDDFANITEYKYDKQVGTSSVRLASRMLGGGYRLWYQDGSFYGIHTNLGADKQVPRYNPNNPGNQLPYGEDISEKRGAQLVYKSVPTDESKTLAEQVATSVFENNRALGTGISGGCITNNGELEFGDDTPYTLKIMKSWTGDKKKDRPKEITLQMFVGEHYVEDITLKEKEDWTAEIADFPDPDTLIDNKTGKLLPINFKEKDSGKYVLSVVSREKDSKNSIYTILLKNSLNTSVQVTKKWIDNENKQGLRPESITVGLLANGKDTGKTLVLSAKTNWKGEFEKLPMYENDEIVKYEVKEISKIKGYTSKIEGNASDGYIITNTIKPDKPPKKPKSPETSDSNNTNILCIALTAASLAVIYILRRKKKL